MNRLDILNPDRLPVFAVLEPLDSERILADRMTRLIEIWKEHDPPEGAAYDVETLEFDPIKIVEETCTYFELLLRDRVNAAAKSVTLAYATGGDLDAIASRYPGGVPRLEGEDDERYRRRIWLSPATLSPHGIEEAYVFWALTADPTLKDATATTIEGTGHVYVTITASGPDPRPTQDQINQVRAYIYDHARKALTDIVSVLPPRLIETKIILDVWLFPGPDAKVAMAALRASLEALVERQAWLAVDLTRMSIAQAAGNVTGVQDVRILEPATNLLADQRSMIRVTDIELTLRGRRVVTDC